jgi:hypothetical protein
MSRGSTSIISSISTFCQIRIVQHRAPAPVFADTYYCNFADPENVWNKQLKLQLFYSLPFYTNKYFKMIKIVHKVFLLLITTVSSLSCQSGNVLTKKCL